MISSPARNYRDAAFFIVDDDDVDAMALERSLRKMNLLNPLHRARDGQEALEILRTGRIPGPHIILLDLNMPRMGGLEFLKIIRTDPAFTSTVVFVLTTSKSDEDITAAYLDHVAGYIFKQRMDSGFIEVINFIDRYFQLVELPIINGKKAS
jgi:CheY-like chemotaxis protein